MKCLTCKWWDGEEGETAPCYGDQPNKRRRKKRPCYGAMPVILGDESIYGEWPLTSEYNRCPEYRRHYRKTLTALYWAFRRWWYRRGESNED